jgi:hypothetical protein
VNDEYNRLAAACRERIFLSRVPPMKRAVPPPITGEQREKIREELERIERERHQIPHEENT